MKRPVAPKAGNIYLIGLMGSGKTTVGHALARRLGWKFIDTDRVIEKMAGWPIREIFAKEGEKAFRRLEQKAVAQAAKKVRCVISVGGGAVTNSKNTAVMKRTGMIVYLQISAATALRRVEKEGIAKRPLLAGHDPGNRLRILKDLLARRRPSYSRCSDIRISSASRNPQQIAACIIRLLI